jgi:thymidylate synthase
MGKKMKQYLNLVQDILENGVQKDDRTETGTLSLFGRQ